MNVKITSPFRTRLCMTIIGVLLCSFAVSFFKCSLFGVDPFQCFAQGLWEKIFSSSISYGSFYVFLSLLLLSLDYILDRHYIGLATFINLFLTGYIIDFSVKIIQSAFPFPTLLTRIIFLFLGITVMCLASSLYMTADLGVSVYDAIPIIISNKKQVPFRVCRIGTDALCVLIGFGTGFLPGIGTLITALFMGPLIDFFNRTISRPLLYRAKKE